MRIYVKAKVLSVENEGDIVVRKRLTHAAQIVLQTLDGETLCAACWGKERVQVFKEKQLSGDYAETVLTLVGRVLDLENGKEQYKYVNNLSVKWIMS